MLTIANAAIKMLDGIHPEPGLRIYPYNLLALLVVLLLEFLFVPEVLLFVVVLRVTLLF